MRLLKHPGRPLRPRRLFAEARPGGDWRVSLPSGSEFTAALTEALAARGIRQAALQLVGGGFASLQLKSSEPDASGTCVASYGAPRHPEGPLQLLDGNGILGLDEQGRPRLHCHAVAVDRQGRLQGGRLCPEGCLVGEEGLVVLVAALDGAGFAAVHDPETNVTLFEPAVGAA